MKPYTYVMSDIHGQYDAFKEMLKKIRFKDDDTLYIIGDIFDRGPHPVKILIDIMNSNNMILLCGNHEHMAVSCLNYLVGFDAQTLKEYKHQLNDIFYEWKLNGGDTTLNELLKCDDKTLKQIVDYLKKLRLYKEIKVADKTFILVHAGLGNFEENKALKEYSIDELLWKRTDYNKQYFKDKYIITGHTPTRFIEDNDKPDYIYMKNNNINIDCCCAGAVRLGCLRLDDMKEYYVEIDKDIK